MQRGKRVRGVVYLANNLAPRSFPVRREKTAELLLAQASVSLENPTLFAMQGDTESALRASENDMAEAQRIASIGSFDSNIYHDELSWSQELYRIHFKDSETFTPTRQAFVELLHPDDRAAWLREMENSLNTVRPLETDHRILAPDGSPGTLLTTAHVQRNDDGEIIGLQGAVQDVTDCRRAEDELRSNAARFERWKSSNFIGILQTSSRRDIIDANGAVLEMLGYSRQDLREGKLN